LVVLVVAGLLGYGWHRFEAWREKPGEAERIAETTTVAGFVRAAVVDLDDGVTDAYFIGPAPQPDPVSVVSVPTIRLSPVAPELDQASDPEPRHDQVVAKGQRRDGCGASVVAESDPMSDLGPDWTRKITLTNDQLAAVRRGTKTLFVVGVFNCGQ
jgi:hypothetical protein